MHTFKASDGTVFLYKMDLSEVLLDVNNDQIEDISYLNENTTCESISRVQVSGLAMREFIGSHIRDMIVKELESVNIAELFRGLK